MPDFFYSASALSRISNALLVSIYVIALKLNFNRIDLVSFLHDRSHVHPEVAFFLLVDVATH